MAQRSDHAFLDDRYRALLGKKRNTKYERLAALAVLLFERGYGKVAQVTLVGARGEVAHQICADVEGEGDRRTRFLAECIDFDLEGPNLGVRAIRKFERAARAVGADMALMLSCKNFTKEAHDCARAAKISILAVPGLSDPDWEALALLWIAKFRRRQAFDRYRRSKEYWTKPFDLSKWVPDLLSTENDALKARS
jgi:hypothetical protein